MAHNNKLITLVLNTTFIFLYAVAFLAARVLVRYQVLVEVSKGVTHSGEETEAQPSW